MVLLSAGGTARAEGGDVVLLMERLQYRTTELETGLKKAVPPEGLLDLIGLLRDDFSQLADLYDPRYGGDLADWRRDCARSQESLLRVEQAVGALHWAEAQAAFQEIRQIQSEAHRVFRPKLLKKIAQFFRRKNVQKKESHRQ